MLRKPTPIAVTRIKPSDVSLMESCEGVMWKIVRAMRTVNHSS